jgi:hypothetical protein
LKTTLALLRNIKDVAFSFTSEKYKVHALHEAKRRFYLLYQEKNSTCQSYLEKFKNQVDVIEHCGGSVVDEDMVADMLPENVDRFDATRDQITAARKEAKEQYLAVAFLLSSDRNRYGKLIEDLENDYTQGGCKYPVTMTESYNLLMHWKQDPKNVMRMVGATSDGVAFVTS